MEWFKKLTNKSGSSAKPAADQSTHAAKTVKVSDFLSEKNIFILPAGPSKQQVFGKLIGSFDLPDPSAALKAILAREEMGSTIIEPGLALPHARISGIPHVVAAVGICPTGVVDHRSGGAPINVFVLFLGPSDNMKENLAFLASVSALFQKEGLLSQLVQLTTPHAVMDAIRHAE